MSPKTVPFPNGLHETSLERLPLSGLLDHNDDIEKRLYDCCINQGFFYLDLSETTEGKVLLAAADRLHDVSEQAFRIPLERKQAIGFDKTESLFGWKAAGITAAGDVYKRKDVGQFFNISKDDVLKNPGCLNVAYPSPIKEEIEKTDLCRNFMQNAHGIGLAVLDCLERKLGISRGELASRHRITELAGDHIRMTYGPGDLNAAEASSRDEASTRITTSEHTDFGSVTLLFNWMGGLQIENGNTGQWEWVRPAKGHAICNLGDAMVTFSGSTLRSGKHRVVTAPGEQSKFERYSIVYFVRPEDKVYMEDLTKPHGSDGASKCERRWTAGEWIKHRATVIGNKLSGDEKQ